MQVKGSFAVPRQVRIVENGKVEVKKTIEAKGITLEMLNLYNALPNTLEKYRAWHPDHIDRKVVQRPGKHTYVLETQRIGKHVYHMRAFHLQSGRHATHSTRRGRQGPAGTIDACMAAASRVE